MRIGTLRVVLDFFNNTNLAQKRRDLSELCEMLRKQFGVSSQETEAFEDPERGVLGVALVFPAQLEMPKCRQRLEAIAQQIDASAPARVISEEMEFFEHAGEFDPTQDV